MSDRKSDRVTLNNGVDPKFATKIKDFMDQAISARPENQLEEFLATKWYFGIVLETLKDEGSTKYDKELRHAAKQACSWLLYELRNTALGRLDEFLKLAIEDEGREWDLAVELTDLIEARNESYDLLLDIIKRIPKQEGERKVKPESVRVSRPTRPTMGSRTTLGSVASSSKTSRSSLRSSGASSRSTRSSGQTSRSSSTSTISRGSSRSTISRASRMSKRSSRKSSLSKKSRDSRAFKAWKAEARESIVAPNPKVSFNSVSSGSSRRSSRRATEIAADAFRKSGRSDRTSWDRESSLKRRNKFFGREQLQSMAMDSIEEGRESAASKVSVESDGRSFLY